MARQQQYEDRPAPKRETPDFKTLAKEFDGEWKPTDLEIAWEHNDELETVAQFREVLYFCKAKGLDPITGDVYAGLRYNSAKGKKTLTMIVGINVLRERRAAECGGISKFDLEIDEDTGMPISATGSIWRKGIDRPFTTTIYFDEYTGRTRDGKYSYVWANKPKMLLSKCLEAALTRLALSDLCSGMYIEEELSRKGDSNGDESTEQFDVVEKAETEQPTEKPAAKRTKGRPTTKSTNAAPAQQPDPGGYKDFTEAAKPKEDRQEPKPEPKPDPKADPKATPQQSAAKPDAEAEAFKKRLAEVAGDNALPMDVFLPRFRGFAAAMITAKGDKRKASEIPITAWNVVLESLEAWLKTDEGKYLFIQADKPKELGELAASNEPPTPAAKDASAKPKPKSASKASDPDRYADWVETYEWTDRAKKLACELIASLEGTENAFTEDDFHMYLSANKIDALDGPSAEAALSMIKVNIGLSGRIMALRKTLKADVVGVLDQVWTITDKLIDETSPEELERAITQLENSPVSYASEQLPIWERN